MNEDKQIVKDYMTAFYEHIKNLNASFSVYSNTLIEIMNLYKGDFNLLQPTERVEIINRRHAVVNELNNTHFMYSAIASNDPKHDKSKDHELNQIVSKINDKFIFDRKDLKKYIDYINAYIIKKNYAKFFIDKQSVVGGFRK